jgi:hypothetical protein
MTRVLLLCASSSAPATQSPPRRIIGVFDNRTREPIAGVEVRDVRAKAR